MNPNRRRARLLLAPLASAILVAPPVRAAAAIPAARDSWVEARTPSFVVLANTGERKAREIALSFERFRQALQLLRADASPHPAVPLRVVAFADDRGFDPYKIHPSSRDAALVGQFQHSQWADHILLNAFPRHGDALPVIYHESVHAFLRSNFTNLPLWLEEGLAELFATFAIERGEMHVGKPDPRHVAILRERTFLPLAELFAIDQSSPSYREGERVGIFYAESWLLVHYVMLGGGERVGKMRAFLDGVRGGDDATTAFRSAFGMTMPELEKELRGYVNTPTFPYLRVPVASLGAEPPVTVREVPAAEALYELGTSLALRGGDTADAARAHLEAAAPTVPDAWASLAWLEQRLGRTAAAAELHREAADRGAGRPVSLALRAQWLLREKPSANDAILARALARTALQLEPGYAEAQALFGKTFLLTDGPSQEGMEALAAALERLPGRPDLAHDLAMLHLRSGDVATAERLVREVVTPLANAETVAHAERALERVRVKAALDPALESGDAARAEAALQAALATARDPELRAELEQRLAEATRHRVSAERYARYNRAIDRANGGDVATAERELRALRDEATEPALLAAIDATLEKLAAARRR